MAAEAQSGWVTFVQVGAACLSPIIALLGGWIAWQQVRINRNKLKLDRFDRRFEIHEAAMTFVAAVCSNGVASEDHMREFLAKTRGARFLLSQEIADYLESLYVNAGRLRSVHTFMQTPTLTDAKRAEYADRWTEMETWFQDQLKVIPDRFAPFLSVDEI